MTYEMPYPIAPEKWAETPIKRTINPLTHQIEGDDHGSHAMRTLLENEEPLVELRGVEVRPYYDGVNEYGESDDSVTLKGGLLEPKLLVREMVAKSLEYAQSLLDQYFDSDYRIVVLDGFRSHFRQSDGFTRTLQSVLAQNNLHDPSIFELLQMGRLTNSAFSWVPVDTESTEYYLAKNYLQKKKIKGITTPEDLHDLIIIGANTSFGPTSDFEVPLDFETNAHAGGGAVDMMLVDAKGQLLSLIPFDFVGEEAAIDYLEDDRHFELFKEKVSQRSDLIRHLKKLGYEKISDFSFEEWERIKQAMRVLYHLMKSIGSTYYSASPTGEAWHFEPDGIALYSPEGKLIYKSPLAEHFEAGSGTPGHTLQKLGPEAVAIYGGFSAHQQVMDQLDFGI